MLPLYQHSPEPTPAPSGTVWVNEFHYDNQGTDENEFFEIAGPAGTNLTGYSVAGYSGGTSGHYGTYNLSGILPDDGEGYGALAFDAVEAFPPLGNHQGGLQNGSPDGFGLINPDNVCIEFIAYEGSMTASRADGDAGGSACDGVEGQDIGVFEQNNTA